MICYDRTIFGRENLESEGAKNLNSEKLAFNVVQIKFLAIHITNHKLSFDIFMVEHLQNIFMEHDLNLKGTYYAKSTFTRCLDINVCWQCMNTSTLQWLNPTPHFLIPFEPSQSH